MKITQFKIFAYKLPLARKLYLKGKEITSREGLVICLESDQGGRGWGEVSPLPEFSRETLAEALRQLRDIKAKFLNVPLPKIDLMQGKLAEWIGESRCSPSTRMGIEMAILTLSTNSQHQPLAEAFSRKHESVVRVSGLLQGDKSTVVAQAEKMVKAGYRTVKLKVGMETVDEEIEKVRLINAVIENKALLRLDANRAWNFDEAVQFGQAIGIAALEYIEEPCRDISKLEEFYNETTIPVALDESLVEKKFDDLKSIQGVDVLILKPTLLGGFEKAWQLLTDARSLGLRCIISSSFETGLGLQALAHLAACGAPDVPMGLDTAGWFANDIYKHHGDLTPQIKIAREDFLLQKINEQYLTEVPV